MEILLSGDEYVYIEAVMKIKILFHGHAVLQLLFQNIHSYFYMEIKQLWT